MKPSSPHGVEAPGHQVNAQHTPMAAGGDAPPNPATLRQLVAEYQGRVARVQPAGGEGMEAYVARTAAVRQAAGGDSLTSAYDQLAEDMKGVPYAPADTAEERRHLLQMAAAGLGVPVEQLAREMAAGGAAPAPGHSWRDYGQQDGRNRSWCSRCEAVAWTGEEPDAPCTPAAVQG